MSDGYGSFDIQANRKSLAFELISFLATLILIAVYDGK